MKKLSFKAQFCGGLSPEGRGVAWLSRGENEEPFVPDGMMTFSREVVKRVPEDAMLLDE